MSGSETTATAEPANQRKGANAPIESRYDESVDMTAEARLVRLEFGRSTDVDPPVHLVVA
jgi:hypothetical protein